MKKYPTWPVYSEAEINIVSEVLRSGNVNYWTGTHVNAFEEEFSKFLSVKHSVAVSNGTAALELCLYAIGISAGDEVIVPSKTFVATASSVIRLGGKPVFADVDKYSQTITSKSIEEVITSRTKAIIVVHLGGCPCEMNDILDVANKHNLKIIEDCAQSHGAIYKGKYAGSIGDIAAFSFCQDKIMSTGGEGGMVVTNDDGLWKKVWEYKEHGKSYKKTFNKEISPTFVFVHDGVGTNMRMTELQAAIGRIQLKKLPDWIKRRNLNTKALIDTIGKHPSIKYYKPNNDVQHAYYRFYVFLESDDECISTLRDNILTSLRDAGIPCHYGSCNEVYIEKAFSSFANTGRKRMPNAKWLSERSFCFLVHPSLDDECMHNIAERSMVILSNIL